MSGCWPTEPRAKTCLFLPRRDPSRERSSDFAWDEGYTQRPSPRDAMDDKGTSRGEGGGAGGSGEEAAERHRGAKREVRTQKLPRLKPHFRRRRGSHLAVPSLESPRQRVQSRVRPHRRNGPGARALHRIASHGPRSRHASRFCDYFALRENALRTKCSVTLSLTWFAGPGFSGLSDSVHFRAKFSGTGVWNDAHIYQSNFISI